MVGAQTVSSCPPTFRIAKVRSSPGSIFLLIFFLQVFDYRVDFFIVLAIHLMMELLYFVNIGDYIRCGKEANKKD